VAEALLVYEDRNTLPELRWFWSITDSHTPRTVVFPRPPARPTRKPRCVHPYAHLELAQSLFGQVGHLIVSFCDLKDHLVGEIVARTFGALPRLFGALSRSFAVLSPVVRVPQYPKFSVLNPVRS
jgi:hypothetical protein